MSNLLSFGSGDMSLWILFNIFILVLLYLDLKVFHKKDHSVSVKEALTWSAIWIAIALVFNAGIYLFLGAESGITFLTGYLIEKSLSVDNLFVFLLIFSYFKVPGKFQHKILFYGILGALIMRCVFIFAGVALLTRFHWLIYVMGAFLVLSGLKLIVADEDEDEEEGNWLIRYFHRLAGPPQGDEDGSFWQKVEGKLRPTRLFYVLLAVELTDLVFAIDSIPAILAITTDPFIVYSSNVFAILGLRALYFALAGLMQVFRYLDYGISAVLVFVGVKMLISGFVHLPAWVTLGFIFLSLSSSVIVSIIKKEEKKESESAHEEQQIEAQP